MSKLVDAVVAIFIGMVLGPLMSLFLAWTLKTSWSWFLTEYGSGPSIEAWYGISTMIGFLFIYYSWNIPRKEKSKDQLWTGRMLVICAIHSVIILTYLGAASVMRFLMGW